MFRKDQKNAAEMPFQKQNFKTYKSIRSFAKFTCRKAETLLGQPYKLQTIELAEVT